MTINLTEEEKIRVLNGDDLYSIMQRILLREQKIDQNREHFWIVGLESNNRILFIELISLGSIKSTTVHPMEVFSLALQKRSAKIILVHNHPSGNLSPSEADKDMTDRLIQVGIIVDTPVFDHLIITLKSYMSFREIGLLKILERSTKYVPPYKLQDRMRKEAKEIGKKEGFKEVAKKLKLEGVDEETISKVTGLSIEDIKKIRISKKKG